MEYKEKYIKYKKKYLELKKQLGGVRYCANDDLSQMLYNIYGSIIQNLSSHYGYNIGATRGSIDKHPNSCNLWIWKHSYPYNVQLGDVNHFDLYYDVTNNTFNIQVKRDNRHIDRVNLETGFDNYDNSEIIHILTEQLIQNLDYYFP
jgi:hypothetical protein